MRNLISAFLLVSLPTLAVADEFADLEKRLQLATKRLQVQAEEAKLVAEELKLAAQQKTIAEHRRDAAKAQADAESNARLMGLPNIEVHVGTIEVTKEPQRKCIATDFLRYTCHRTHSCPPFAVDNKICALPGGEDEPMVLKVNFSCGTQVRDQTIPVGQMAYITCK